MSTNKVLQKRKTYYDNNDDDGSDSGGSGSDDEEEDSNVFEVFDAHVHEIKSVQNNMIRALCRQFYEDRYPIANVTQKTMSIEEARQSWNQDPRFVQRRQHADNAEQAADDMAQGFNGSDDANAFGQLIDDNNDNALDIEAVLNYASMSSDTDDYSALKEDNYKRHVSASTIRATVVVKYDGGQKMARVTGVWPVLSASIALHIRGVIERKATSGSLMSVVVANKTSTIELAQIETVSGREFYNILRESGSYELPIVHKYVAQLFVEAEPGVNQELSQTDQQPRQKQQKRIVYAGRHAAEQARRLMAEAEAEASEQANHVRRVNEAAYAIAARNRITVAELRRRIDALGDPNILKMMVRAPFVSLGPLMVLRSQELCFIAMCYEDVDLTVWREALARGIDYIDELYSLLTTRPHVLCFERLRKIVGKERSVPTLGTLPDLSLVRFQQLSTMFGKSSSVIETAVAIYKNILCVDVHGEKQRSADEPYGTVPASSGHMFTVFADHPDNQNAAYFHETNEAETDPRRLCDENPGTFAGRFCLLPRGETYQREMCVWLGVDRRRISKNCTHDDFIAALHWLIEQELVVTQRFTGTGKYNRGRPVDAFYLADIYEKQTRLISLLSDIYDRGIKHSQNGPGSGDDQNQLSPPRLIALQRVQHMARAKYYKLYTNAVKEIGKAAAAKTNNDAEDASESLGSSDTESDGDDDNDDDDDDNDNADANDENRPKKPKTSLIARLARKIAKDDVEWREHYEQYLKECTVLQVDAYVDARGTQPHRRMPLLRVAPFSRFTRDGQPLGDEQIAALERLAWSPIVQITGRGGVGKSEIVWIIMQMYPPEQILCVAPTSNVASDLTARTGHKAYTIHSVLTRYYHYLEAHSRAMSFRRRALKYAGYGQRPGAGAGAALRRAEEFKLEDVMACTDDRELRAYVDYMLASYPPFTNPFDGKTVLIFDELSLSSLAIAKNLIDAFHSPRNGRAVRRFICLGDFDQLPPIGSGSYQSDIGHGMPSTVCELVRNRRSTGTQLFNNAQGMAEHRYRLPMPEFTNKREAFQAIKRGDDIVSLECSPSDLVKTIENVILELRCTEDLERRKLVQFIATTNETARITNETIRHKYYGEQMLDEFADNLQARINEQNAAAGNAAVSGRELLTQASYKEKLQAERERINKMLYMQVRIDDRIFLTRNCRVRFPNGHEVQFSNSRRLRACQFYDAPLRVTKTNCRCGLCPIEPLDNDDDDNSDAGGGKRKRPKPPCMERPDLVPPRRCCRSERIQYHDQGAVGLGGSRIFRRMGVFQDDNGAFVEMDVLRMLVPRSRYGNGFALTTHRLQGSQAPIVVYICVDDRWYINWKYLYTAFTRARQQVIILSTQKVFDRLVRRKAPLRRSLMWFELLRSTTAVLKQYPHTEAYRHAKQNFPALFQLDKLSTDDQWAILEDARYRTDRVRAQQT